METGEWWVLFGIFIVLVSWGASSAIECDESQRQLESSWASRCSIWYTGPRPADSIFWYQNNMEIIAHVDPPIPGPSTDRLVLSLTSNGIYSVKVRYSALKQPPNAVAPGDKDL